MFPALYSQWKVICHEFRASVQQISGSGSNNNGNIFSNPTHSELFITLKTKSTQALFVTKLILILLRECFVEISVLPELRAFFDEFVTFLDFIISFLKSCPKGILEDENKFIDEENSNSESLQVLDTLNPLQGFLCLVRLILVSTSRLYLDIFNMKALEVVQFIEVFTIILSYKYIIYKISYHIVYHISYVFYIIYHIMPFI